MLWVGVVLHVTVFYPPLIIPWQVSHQVHHGLSSQDKVSYPLRLSHSALEQCSGGSWGSVTLVSFPWFISWSMQRPSEKVTKILPCVMSGRNGGATKPALMHAQGSSFRTPGTVGASDIVHVTRFPMPSSLHTASNEVLEVVKACLGISKGLLMLSFVLSFHTGCTRSWHSVTINYNSSFIFSNCPVWL